MSAIAMATPKSLKARIEALFNALGGAHKPSNAKIRSELSTFASLAETLENDQATAKKEAKIAALKAENENLKVELQTANGEIKRFQAERKKQEEKERDIPPIQFQILSWLPSEHGGEWQRVDEIASAVGIKVDETEIHLDRLKKADLAESRYNAFDALIWHRTMRGNEYVLAKRLAGEEQTLPRKYPDLPIIEESMLAMMVGESEGVREELIHDSIRRKGMKITLEKVKYLLRTSLEKKGFAAYDDEEATYGMGNTWFITGRGTEYFAERDKL
jgi:DNA-binding MarR family transcriptional regulator